MVLSHSLRKLMHSFGGTATRCGRAPCNQRGRTSRQDVLAMVPAMVVLPDGPLRGGTAGRSAEYCQYGINILRGPAGHRCVNVAVVGLVARARLNTARETLSPAPVAQVHFGPTGAVTLVGVVKDDLTRDARGLLPSEATATARIGLR